MSEVSQIFGYWIVAFVTLGIAVLLLHVFYRLIDADPGLHSLAKEAAIAGVASVAQAAGFWVSASLFSGEATRRLVIPGALVGIIYKLGHLDDWSGYEVGGIMLFQMVLLGSGTALLAGQYQVALIALGAFAIALMVVASIAKSL